MVYAIIYVVGFLLSFILFLYGRKKNKKSGFGLFDFVLGVVASLFWFVTLPLSLWFLLTDV